MLTAEKKAGWVVSGAMHAAVLVLALFGADWFADREPRPLNVTSVELIDGSQFDAALSTAPVVPNEGPAELSPPSETRTETLETAEAAPDSSVRAPDMPLLARPETPPDQQPDFQSIQVPPPPTPVPSEALRPSIAEIPTPETLPRQAAEPESPPATEPVQPLASAPTPDPAPAPPPEPEPVAAEEPEPQAEEPKQEPQPEAVAEAQPEAPVAAAPQEARLPVAKPAKLAAAARASSAPEPVAAAPEPEKQAEQKPQEPKPQQVKPEEPKPAKPAGGSTSQFAATVTPGEKDALRLGIKRYFVYNGNRSDRALRVTIAIELGRDARIVGGPELIRASGGDDGAQRALWQAGRRALIKAENAGEFAKLPVDKYEGWRLIHVTFTPEEIGFKS